MIDIKPSDFTMAKTKDLVKMKTLQSIAIAVLLIINTSYAIASDNGCQIEPGTEKFFENNRHIDGGGRSLLISWDRPTKREDKTDLSADKIKGYLIVGVPASKKKEFVEYMTTIDPETFDPETAKSLLERGYLSLPEQEDRSLFPQESLGYAVFITCTGKTTLLLENMKGGDTYYFWMSTKDTDDQYSKLTEVKSRTIH
jgi:hypothetical protein